MKSVKFVSFAASVLAFGTFSADADMSACMRDNCIPNLQSHLQLCSSAPNEAKAQCYENAQSGYERCQAACEKKFEDNGAGVPVEYVYIAGLGWTWIDIYGNPV